MTAPNVAIAAGFGDRAPRKRMRLISFKPVEKGALRGFANVELPNGLRISDCPVCVASSGHVWAALPSKPVVNSAGMQVVSGDGKRQFAPILSWRDRATNDAWSAAVIELVRAAYPEALPSKSTPS